MTLKQLVKRLKPSRDLRFGLAGFVLACCFFFFYVFSMPSTTTPAIGPVTITPDTSFVGAIVTGVLTIGLAIWWYWKATE